MTRLSFTPTLYADGRKWHANNMYTPKSVWELSLRSNQRLLHHRHDPSTSWPPAAPLCSFSRFLASTLLLQISLGNIQTLLSTEVILSFPPLHSAIQSPWDLDPLVTYWLWKVLQEGICMSTSIPISKPTLDENNPHFISPSLPTPPPWTGGQFRATPFGHTVQSSWSNANNPQTEPKSFLLFGVWGQLVLE